MPPREAALPSLVETADHDPYGFYDRAREQGVVWDQAMNGWLVTSYASVRQVMREDKKLVRHATAGIPDPNLHKISGGKRSRLMLNGEEHARHHRWIVRRFSYSLVDQWRETLLRPIADQLLDAVVDDGRIEVLRDYSDRFSIRVISAVMGFPWEDGDWITHCKALLDCKQRYLDVYATSLTPEIERQALDAADEMNELLLPFVLAAKEREPREDDVLALLWAEGPTIMPDWGLEDVQAWIATMFFAGTDTTTHAIQNAVYLLLELPELRETVRTGSDEILERFAEEVLRLYPSVHYTRRLANQDFEVEGARVKRDDRLYMLDAAANRDPQRFERPAAIDLDRDAWRDHLAFSVGPRTCAGAALARAEVQESVRKLLERLPGLRAEPGAEPPSLQGFLLRSYRPLHAVFDLPGS